MMSCKRIADPLQFIQRGFQRPLLDPAFAHDITQQGDANVTHLRQRVGTRFPPAKLPDHVRAVQQHHAPAQQPAPGKRGVMPECTFSATNSYEDAKEVLKSMPVSIVLLDGDMDYSKFVEELELEWPMVPIVIMFYGT